MWQLPTSISLENNSQLPVIETAMVLRVISSFETWLNFDNKQPFIIAGPEGCGKGWVVLHLSCGLCLYVDNLTILHIRHSFIQLLKINSSYLVSWLINLIIWLTYLFFHQIDISSITSLLFKNCRQMFTLFNIITY